MTLISALGLSQLLTVWLTQYDVVPVVAVEGVGAVVLPVPPVADVYQRRLLPLAVRAVAVAPWQYVTSCTVGAAGGAVTVTVIAARGLSQPEAVTWLT